MSARPALSPCAALVRRHDPDRFLCALFAPAGAREALFTLYAFNHELARAREAAREPTLALIRLQWWREVVEGTRKRHEVAEPLADAIAQGLLVPGDLLAMIEGREAETEPAIADRAVWLAYLSATAGGVMAAAGRLLGADEALRARLSVLGTVHGIAGQVRNAAPLARAGRVLLPLDVLERHGLTTHDVTAGKGGEALHGALRALSAEGQAMLRGVQGPVPRGAVAAALPAVLARRDLARRRPVEERGLGDRLAVLRAWLLCRV